MIEMIRKRGMEKLASNMPGKNWAVSQIVLVAL